MKTWTEFLEEFNLNECIKSASKALASNGIPFETVGGKLKVSEGDLEKAKTIVKTDASDPGDIKFLTA